MATGTHRLNNRLLVEEKEESCCSERVGDFQQIAPNHVQVCFVCFDIHKHSQKKKLYTHSYKIHTNRCKFVSIACLLSSTMVIVFGCLPASIMIPHEVGTKTRQEILCNDMCLYIWKHLAHNNILCILCGINNNTAEPTKCWLAPEGLQDTGHIEEKVQLKTLE